MYIQEFILSAAISYQGKLIKFKDTRFCNLSVKGNLETVALAPK